MASSTRPQTTREQWYAFAAWFLFSPYHRLFRHTCNPLYCWIVYKQARAKRIPVPGWVLAYLDECARRVTAANGTTSPKAVAKAFDLHPAHTRRKRMISELNYLAICDHVMIETYRRRRRAPDQAVFDLVAQEVGRKWKPMTGTTVKKIYYQWRGISTRRGVLPPEYP
jgi:hypothetical protein